MNCRELTNDLLADHAGWKLAPEEQRLVSVHLEACGPCRGRQDDVESLASALRNTAPRPPAALLEELDRAVLGALPRPQRRPRPWTWAAAAALLLAAVGLASIQLLKPAPEAVPVVAAPPAPEPKPEPKVEIRPEIKIEAPKPEPKPEPKPDPPAGAPKPELPKPDLPAEAPPPDRPKEGPSKPPSPALKPVEPPKPPPSPPPPPKVVVLGDVDGDGVTDIADARRIQQALVLGLPLPPEADVNGDGVVDVADVRQITRAEVGAR